MEQEKKPLNKGDQWVSSGKRWSANKALLESEKITNDTFPLTRAIILESATNSAVNMEEYGRRVCDSVR